MDNLEGKTPEPATSSDLTGQLEALRQLVISLLILMLVVSGTFNIYLLRQYKSTRTDLRVVRPQAAQIIGEYNKTTGPLMQDFLRRLQEFARKNPDFAPVLAKYGISLSAPTSLAPATGAPPAAAAPKK